MSTAPEPTVDAPPKRRTSVLGSRPRQWPRSWFRPAPESTRLALIGLTLAALFWAGNALVARGAGDLAPPLALSFLRWFFCALLLLPFTVLNCRRQGALIRRHGLQILILAALSISSYNSLLYWAAHTTTALNITLVSTLLPVITVLLSRPLLGQAITASHLVGILGAFCGAAFIILRGDWRVLLGLEVHGGDALMLLATFLWAWYSVLLRRWSLPMSGFALFTLLVPTGVVLLLPAFLLERHYTADVVLTPELALVLLYVVVFPSLAAYLLWNYGVSRTSPSTAALFACLMPLFTAILSIPLLGEYPQSYHLVGGLAILAGLWWSQR